MRVLLCDDDASVREFLSAMFEVDGWDVDAVESGEDCLEILEALQPDVLVVDQMMPGLQGTEVAEEARSNGFERPIVLCSSNLAAARKQDIARLNLVTVNKVDSQAVVRVARAAYLESQLTSARPAGRRRQVWPD